MPAVDPLLLSFTLRTRLPNSVFIVPLFLLLPMFPDEGRCNRYVSFVILVLSNSDFIVLSLSCSHIKQDAILASPP